MRVLGLTFYIPPDRRGGTRFLKAQRFDRRGTDPQDDLLLVLPDILCVLATKAPRNTGTESNFEGMSDEQGLDV